MPKKGVLELQQMKRAGQRIAWLTAYDYPTATFEQAAGVDMILVGNSLGMCVYGYPGTVPVTMISASFTARPASRRPRCLRDRRHVLRQLSGLR